MALSFTNITITGGMTLTAPVTIVTDGLQLYLDAANPSSYSGTGTTWYDLSGNANDVVMQNDGGITYVPASGGYFSLSSNGFFNNTATTNLPTGTTPYTLSAWVQWPSGNWTGAGGIISIGDTWGAGNSVNAFRSGGSHYLVNYWWGNDYSTAVTLSDYTQWVNVVTQWDGTTRSIWVNGVLQGSAPSDGLTVADNVLQIGMADPGLGEDLSGNIGQVLIYNRALISDEIIQNYTAIAGRYQNTLSPILSLDAANYSGSGPWIDSVGGLQFTLYGSPTYSTGNGGYIEFNPNNGDYAQSSTSLSDLPTWSVEAWHYYTGTNTGSNPCIITEVYPGTTGQINYSLGSDSNGTPDLQSGFFNGNWQVTPTGYSLTPGSWYQIVGTYDGTTIKLYVNNTLVESTEYTGAPISSGGGIRLMSRWDFQELWGGLLGIVNIYNYDIGVSGVNASWNLHSARFSGQPSVTTSFTLSSTDFTTGSNYSTGGSGTPYPNPLGTNGTAGFILNLDNIGTDGAQFANVAFNPYVAYDFTNNDAYTIINNLVNLGVIGSYTGEIWSVTWGPDSTVSEGYVVIGANPNGAASSMYLFISPLDTTVDGWNTNPPNISSTPSLAGTYNLPATFTLVQPVVNKGNNWC